MVTSGLVEYGQASFSDKTKTTRYHITTIKMSGTDSIIN